jgi:uncharacterized membrane-anchored protein
MNRVATSLAVFGLLLIMAAANYTIWQRQQVLDHGQPMLLDLRPVDPRSLMQGDYMVLRYADALFPPSALRPGLPQRGAFVVALDEHNVARYARLDDGSPLADDEALLKYKQVEVRGRIRLGAESFFFEEGQADRYDNARYGVLHVDEAGNSVLVGLADAQWQLLGGK